MILIDGRHGAGGGGGGGGGSRGMVDNKNDKSISPAIKNSLVILRQLKTSGKPPGAQRLSMPPFWCKSLHFNWFH